MASRQRSTMEQRVAWLRAHQSLVDRYLEAGDRRAVHVVIIRAMKADGLVAPTTYAPDCRLEAWVALAQLSRVEPA